MPSTFGLSTQRTSKSTLGLSQPIHVTIKHASPYSEKRHLIINPGQTITIGRASKSGDQSMQPTLTNLLFECPVVSRQHAELKYHRFAPPNEQITITDRDSLHGTSVNDKRLEPHKPFALRSGDNIKIGGKVVRGSDIHDGIEVTFIREILPHHHTISCGTTNTFTVPDPSDDESVASDVESVGEKEKTSSSAATTPEQSKTDPPKLQFYTSMPALGSQQKPIELDKPKSMSVRDIITLNDDADVFVQPRKDVVKDTYAESGAESLAPFAMETSLRGDAELAGKDHQSTSEGAEHLYDDDQDIADNESEASLSDLSDDCRSDLYRSSDEPEHDDDDTEEQQNDDKDDGPEEIFTGGRQPSLELGSPDDTLSTTLNPFDPATWAAPSNNSQAATQLQPCYVAPVPSFGYPWSFESKSVPQFQAGPSKTAADSRLSISNLVEASRDERSSNKPSVVTNGSPLVARQAATATDEDTLSTWVAAGMNEPAAAPEPASVAGTKRKAEDISVDADSAAEKLYEMYVATRGHEVDATRAFIATAEAPASATAPIPATVAFSERPAKRSRVVTQVGKYAASAAVGGVAMFAFLVSPWCEQLLAKV